MSRLYAVGPRRTSLRLEVSPGEIAHNISHGDVLEDFTEEELRKMIECLNLELNRRENENAGTSETK